MNKLNIKIKLFLGFLLVIIIFMSTLFWQFSVLEKIDKNLDHIKNAQHTRISVRKLRLINIYDLQRLLEIIQTENPAAINEIVNAHLKTIRETEVLYDSLDTQVQVLFPNKMDMSRIKIINYLDESKSLFKNVLHPYFENTEKIKKDLLEKGNLFGENQFIDITKQTKDSLQSDSIEAITTVDFIGITASTRKAQLTKIYYFYKQNLEEIIKKLNEIDKITGELASESMVDLAYQSKKIKVYNSLFALFIILVVAFILYNFGQTVSEPLKKLEQMVLELSKGALPEHLHFNQQDEIGSMALALNKLVDGLKRTSLFAIEMGKGNYSGNYKPLSEQDVLGNALLDMHKSLQIAREEEEKRKLEDQQRRWTTEGLAQFGEILRRHTENIKLLSKDIISSLIKYLNANQGGIFILNDTDENDIYLELIAAYAYNREKFIYKRVNLGEGLVGGVAVEKYTIYLTELPEEYIEIESGLGGANPKSLLIVPLKLENQVLGVIEIASFHEFKPYEIELVEKIGESIASTLSTAKINTRTAELLEQSKISEQEMQAQEAQMRQQIEEVKRELEQVLSREIELKEEVEELENMRINFIDRDKRQRAKIQELTKVLNKKSEELEVISTQFERSFEWNIDPVVQFDEARKIIMFNPAAEQLWGYSKSEVLGRNMYELSSEKMARDFEERIALYFKTGRNDLINSIIDATITDKEGKEIPVKLSMSEINYKGTRRIVMFVRSIGKLISLETELESVKEKLTYMEFDFTTKINALENFIKENNMEVPKDLEKRTELIKWNENYSIDLNIIDQQHKKWIDFINILYLSFKNEASINEINENILKLLDYTDYHFGFEEKYLEDFKCGNFEAHKYEHEQFISKIKKYQAMIENGEYNAVYALIVYLNGWVLNHIQNDDKDYVDCFKLNGLS
ncbi:MAG: bacteriohemerythrin [Bacteroidales bacterium]|nr:bacteriohemerythrin [Bacteroidales bacterium]